ncbi:hypothetical protein IWZ01DRAFT_563890 [Phyllosticta capitalensis]
MESTKSPLESQASDVSEASVKPEHLTHFDAYGRPQLIPINDHDEWYLRPSDGRISKVSVQSFEELGTDANWTRIGRPEVKTPWIIQLVYWTYAPTLNPDATRRQSRQAQGQLLLRWIPSCFAMLFLLCVPRNLEGDVRYNGKYDPIRYHDSPGTGASNKCQGDDAGSEESDSLLGNYGHPENDIEMGVGYHGSSSLDRRSVSTNDIDADFDDLPARHMGPRLLCFLNSEENVALGRPEFETRLVADWIEEKGPGADINYVFVSYTRKQFFVAEESDFGSWDITDEQRQHYRQISPQDRKTLQTYGVRAAREAGVAAFWLDFECLQSHGPDGDIDDVWRICDIVRACHSMIIMIGPSIDAKNTPVKPQARDAWLHEWGTRLWTLPEILLMPEPKVTIHTVGGSDRPEVLAKRNFASRAWKDAKLPLKDDLLETRAEQDQGLLRRRPRVDKKDSSFQAFARLSLANDSDRLLERLLCMLPPNPDAEWFHIQDHWSAKLWDIEPIAQIGGILDNETVSLDGAYGATIEWDAMKPPAFFKRQTMMRKFAKILLRGTPIYLFSGILLALMGGIVVRYQPSNPLGIFYLVMGSLVLAVSLAAISAAPALLLNIYGGKFWSTQARLIGIEGRIDLGLAETYLFGCNEGRLKWDKNGSSLDFDNLGRPKSNAPNGHATGDGQEDNGLDQYGMRLFNLIDTYTLRATPFRAKRPPTALIICGQQGGMQRALLCSYNCRDRSFSRETVIRMSTLVLERISRIDRFNLALRRQSGDHQVMHGKEGTPT